jgi:hypothetical protein
MAGYIYLCCNGLVIIIYTVHCVNSRARFALTNGLQFHDNIAKLLIICTQSKIHITSLAPRISWSILARI